MRNKMTDIKGYINIRGYVDVKGYEDRYKINDAGNICSLLRDKMTMLKWWTVNDYPCVHLINKNGKRRKWFVHILVAIHFVKNPKPDEWHFVNHKDRDRMNPAAYNLEWSSRQYNNQYIHKDLETEDIF